ncbi:MAG: NAD(P)-binding protein [Sphingomonadaceae bacterium]
MIEVRADYLIIGSGAVGLAFADTLLEQSDARIAIVDRHAKPGGHWNDAYPFVALHQPSAFYGVASLPLGSGRIDASGPNAGYLELASGTEVSAYFEQVMQQRLLPSGRVSYHPLSDYHDNGDGTGRIRSCVNGGETTAIVSRKTVDATYYGTTVPSTHTPKFRIGEGVRVIAPNALPHVFEREAEQPERFVVLGAGKTAMDVIVWLLRSGADADAIHWVCPRDSWLLNRHTTQPGGEFFDQTIGGQLAIMDALAQASDVDELFLQLERAGVMLRIDPAVRPAMFHYATIAQGEVDLLRTVRNVVRLGRVSAIYSAGMTLGGGIVPVAGRALYIDCTASAVERRPAIPQFNGRRITLQMIRMPQPAFSAALTAFLEANFDDDATKNALGMTVPLPDGVEEYPAASRVNLLNQGAWSQNAAVRAWIHDCRLDGFGRMIASVRPDEPEKIAMIKRIGTSAMAAIGNIPKLMSAVT